MTTLHCWALTFWAKNHSLGVAFRRAQAPWQPPQILCSMRLAVSVELSQLCSLLSTFSDMLSRLFLPSLCTVWPNRGVSCFPITLGGPTGPHLVAPLGWLADGPCGTSNCGCPPLLYCCDALGQLFACLPFVLSVAFQGWCRLHQPRSTDCTAPHSVERMFPAVPSQFGSAASPAWSHHSPCILLVSSIVLPANHDRLA